MFASVRPISDIARRRGAPRLLASLGLLLALAPGARAQTPPAEGDLPVIRITDPSRNLFKLAIPKQEGDGQAVDVLRRDLDISGFFDLLDPQSFPPALHQEGLGYSSALWSQVGAQGVVKMKGTGGNFEGRLYVMGRGEAPLISRAYKASEARAAAHVFANDIVEFFTNTRGVFGSRIAFAQTGRGSHEIASVDMDGGEMHVLTKMNSDCLLPSYSPSGAQIAFTSYLRNNPDTWVVSSGGGRARRLSHQPGMNTGAVWSPDGGSMVITLSKDGNSELYRISPSDGSIKGRLTSNPAIDSSPSFSPDGSQIAFVSNRQGSPQIFVMSASGGAAKRVTFQGKYNQTPRWNPDPKKSWIAFTGRDERGVFDVFYIDLKTQQVTRITQAKGSNLDPAWSPDGRLLVYASTRGGLFVANPDTRHETQITHGAVGSPTWGPAPKK